MIVQTCKSCDSNKVFPYGDTWLCGSCGSLGEIKETEVSEINSKDESGLIPLPVRDLPTNLEPKQEPKELNTNSAISSHTPTNLKPTPETLYLEAIQDEQLKIVEVMKLPAEERLQKLVERYKFLEQVIIHAKGRANKVAAAIREDELKSGKNRYDRQVGEVNKSNKSDPRKSNTLKSGKRNKVEDNKLEKMVAGFISLDYDDATLIQMLNAKYKEDDIKLAIKKVREAA